MLFPACSIFIGKWNVAEVGRGCMRVQGKRKLHEKPTKGSEMEVTRVRRRKITQKTRKKH